MPAVTVDDLTVLPRVPAPADGACSARCAPSPPPRRVRGRGLPGPARVRRRRPAPTSTRSSTWTRWARWSTRPGEPKGTPWHPHRGFETVTYIIDGIFDHQDSIGGGGTITNGDTQWMTAGGGILHIEAPPEHLVVSGGLFHGFQLWVNLPRADKLIAAALPGPALGEVALLTSADGGALLRVIAGEVAGHAGPGVTHTPMTDGPRDARARRGARAAVAAGLQRPGLRHGR